MILIAMQNMIDRIEIDTKGEVMKILEKHENKWILWLKTYYPGRFNKLNSIERINL